MLLISIFAFLCGYEDKQWRKLKYEFERAIKQCGKELICREATIKEDFEFAVDLVVLDSKSKKKCAGYSSETQICYASKYIISQNKIKQSRFDCPVIFHVYSGKGNFTPDAKTVILHHTNKKK